MGGRGTLQQTEGEGAVDKSACASSSQALLTSAQPLCGFRKEPPERSARSRGTTSASEPASVHFQLEPTASLSKGLPTCTIAGRCVSSLGHPLSKFGRLSRPPVPTRLTRSCGNNHLSPTVSGHSGAVDCFTSAPVESHPCHSKTFGLQSAIC